MVDSTNYPEKRLIINIFHGSMLHEDVDSIDRNFTKFSSEVSEQIISINSLQFAKIVDRSISKRLSENTKKHCNRIEKVYLVGFTPFMKIMYRMYKKITGEPMPHILADSIEELCSEFNIAVPKKYIELIKGSQE